MQTTGNEIEKAVFDYEHKRDRSLSRDRNRETKRDWNKDKERERDRMKDRDRDRERERERDRDRERERDKEKERDRDKERERDKDREKEREKDKAQSKDDKNKERMSRRDFNKHSEERNLSKDNSREELNSSERNKHNPVSLPTSFTNQFPSGPQPEIFPQTEIKGETVLIKDLLSPPGRFHRPNQLVIILRGPPGSGKSYVAKLIKDKEVENGGSAPRMLCLDDYFMVETEKTVMDQDTGKRIKKKEFEYEYEAEMEEVYQSSLFKSFKKTIDDRFFPFIIVDAINDKVKNFENFWSYAKQRGFQVYIAEMDSSDPNACHKHNVHKRSLEDIKKLINKWEPTPKHYLRVDIRSILQDVSITEVEMEDFVAPDSSKQVSSESSNQNEEADQEENDEIISQAHVISRWEKMETTEEKLDQLDGLRVTKRKHSSMEDYLQLPDDYEQRESQPGKKRVRWADIEERKQQDRIRAIGFVVGQTDWQKMTDPTHADKALTRTKYF